MPAHGRTQHTAFAPPTDNVYSNTPRRPARQFHSHGKPKCRSRVKFAAELSVGLMFQGSPRPIAGFSHSRVICSSGDHPLAPLKTTSTYSKSAAAAIQAASRPHQTAADICPTAPSSRRPAGAAVSARASRTPSPLRRAGSYFSSVPTVDRSLNGYLFNSSTAPTNAASASPVTS